MPPSWLSPLPTLTISSPYRYGHYPPEFSPEIDQWMKTLPQETEEEKERMDATLVQEETPQDNNSFSLEFEEDQDILSGISTEMLLSGLNPSIENKNSPQEVPSPLDVDISINESDLFKEPFEIPDSPMDDKLMALNTLSMAKNSLSSPLRSHKGESSENEFEEEKETMMRHYPRVSLSGPSSHRMSMSLNKNQIRMSINNKVINMDHFEPNEINTLHNFTIACFLQVCNFFNFILSDETAPLNMDMDNKDIMGKLCEKRKIVYHKQELRNCLYFIYKDTIDSLKRNMNFEEDIRNTLYVYSVDKNLMEDTFKNSSVLNECLDVNNLVIQAYRVHNGNFVSKVHKCFSDTCNLSESTLLNSESDNFENLTLKSNAIYHILQNHLVNLSRYADYSIEKEEDLKRESILNASRESISRSINVNATKPLGQPKKKSLFRSKNNK